MKGAVVVTHKWIDPASYYVDPRAVAEAMLASGVFVTLQTGNLVAVLVEEDEPEPDRDVA